MAAALLVASVARLGAQCSGCPNASFGPTGRSYRFPATTWAIGVVSADFNGDGIPDLATLHRNQTDTFLSVFLGTTAETFSISATRTLAVDVSALIAADIDGDGRPDLVLARYGVYGGADPGGITVLLSDGFGDFQSPLDSPAGVNPTTLVAADFTGDGKTDLAVAGSGPSVLILPSAGNGLFGTPISFPVPQPQTSQARQSLVAGDFDNDGLTDLGIIRVDGYLEILLSSGGGSFRPPLWTAVAPLALTLGPGLAGDFNKDGIPDIVVGNHVLIGIGGAHFSPPVSIPGLDFGGTAQAIGDFNQDGIPDLIVQLYAQGLAVAFGDGAGGFSLGPTVPPGDQIYSNPVAVADFDGDGKDDLAIARSDLAIVRGIGGGLFEAATESTTTGAFINSIAAGDFNGDGRLDVVKVDGQNLVVVFNNGDRTFGSPVVTSLPQGFSVAAGDFNGDGRTDVAVIGTGSSNVQVLLGDGTGHFSSPTEFPAGGGGALYVADFNGDGYSDLLVAFGEVRLLLADGHGGFLPPRHVANGTIPSRVAIADVNQDGRLDVLVVSNTLVQSYLGDGLGGFTAGPTTDTQMYVGSLVVGDFDADGHLDFAVARDLALDPRPLIEVFFGSGNGSFGSPLATIDYYGFLLAGDFLGDGRSDLAVSLGNAIVILRVDQTRTLTVSASFLAPGFAEMAADFTGDGKPDLLGRSGYYSPIIWLLENTICRPRRLEVVSNVSSCNIAGTPFSSQPSVRVLDDGANLITCANQQVTASIAPGTGAPGAVLSGTASVSIVSGLATFSDLAVGLPGRDYRLLFQTPGAGIAGSREFSQSLSPPSITASGQTCTGGPDRFEASLGYDTYLWRLDGAVVGRARVLTLTSLSAGSHTLQLAVAQNGCSASASIEVTPTATPPAPVATNNGPVPWGGTIQLSTNMLGRASYRWTGPRGFVSTEENPSIPNASPIVAGTYRVVVTIGGCRSAAASTTVSVVPPSWCPGCANASFGPAARAFDAGNQLSGIAVGDFDGDGNLDVLVSHQSIFGSVTFHPGNGRAELGPGIDTPSPSYLRKILALDLNGDGLTDLAITDGSGVLTAVATGGGHFTPPQRFSFGVPVRDMASGDFNGDGRADVALVNQDGNSVAILLGDAAGGLLPEVIYPVGPIPTAVAVFDLNHDGHDDLVVANASGSISILLGDGLGGFLGAPSVPAPQNVTAIAVGDLDGDGNADLVTADGNFSTGTLSIYAGSGTGSFTLARTISIPGVSQIRIADLRGNGRKDIVLLGDHLYVLASQGGLNFDPVVSHPAGAQPINFALGDFDHDGRVDAAIADGYYSPGSVIVLRGTGGGAGFYKPDFFAVSDFVRGVVAADFNRDGHLDVAVASGEPYGGLGKISVLLADGSGQLGSPTSIPVGGDVARMVAADFNSDGFPDLAIGTYTGGGLLMLISDGNGGFAPPKSYPFAVRELTVGDFNEDGNKDLVIGNETGVTILQGDGAGNLSEGPQLPAPGGMAPVLVGDFNHDGHQDLAVATAAGGGSTGIVLGTGTGTFTMGTTVPIAARFLASGDFNSDGKLDLAVANDHMSILFGDGAGGFAAPLLIGPVPDCSRLLTGDFNGDGKLDLAAPLGNLGGSNSNKIAIFCGNASGGFAAPVLYVVDGPPLDAAVADLDEDGRPDLIVGSYYSGGVNVLSNTNCLVRHLTADTARSCSGPSSPLSPQPLVRIVDDADNVISCDSGQITASIAAGTGATGAVLGGTSAISAVNGVATFTDLSIDKTGTGYQLEFQHPTAAKARTAPFTVGAPPPPPTPVNNGPVCVGQTLTLTADPVAGAVFEWTGPNGFTSSLRNPSIPNVTASASGVYTVTMSIAGCPSPPATTTATVHPLPSSAVTAATSVCPGSSGNGASVPDAGPGAKYAWSITNGAIVSRADGRTISFITQRFGPVTLSVTVTDANGCSSSSSYPVPINRSCPMAFYTVTPCRLVDTRGAPSPNGGPTLPAQTDRAFPLAGRCGIPATATAVSVNVVAIEPTDGPGFFTAYPAGTSRPFISTINYRAGQIRANNAILSLGNAGDLTVHCGQGTGTADVVIDVNGYFQ